jgi:hypothetical protein
MRRAAFILILVAFVFSSGGQWPLLQSVAWANMIRQYSQVVPLAQAVQLTLSGRHPCAMCRAIAAKKQSPDNRIAALFQHEKKIVSPALVALAPRLVVTPQAFALREPILETRSDVPPTPPPRFV